MVASSTEPGQGPLDDPKLCDVADGLFAFAGLLSADGVLLEANRSPLDIAGLSRSQVIGLPFWDCPWWSRDPGVQDRLRSAVRACGDGQAVRYEEQIRTVGDRRLRIDVQLAPVTDDQGSVTMIIVSATETGAITRPEGSVVASESKLRTVFARVDQGCCLCELVTDDNGRVVDYRFSEVNASFEAMTGLSDAAGRTALELVPGLEPIWVDTFAQIAVGVDVVHFRQGSLVMGRVFDVCCVPVEPRGQFALLFSDVTEQERASEELESGARRNRFRAQLTDAFRRIVDPLEVQREATSLLAEHLGVTKVHYVDVRSDDVSRADGTGLAEVAALLRSEWGEGFGGAVVAEVSTGRTVVVDDVTAKISFSDAECTAPAGSGVGALVVAPLVIGGDVAAVLVVRHRQPRAWSSREVGIIEEAAERTRSAVEWARAELELRASETRFRLLADALPLPVWVHGPAGAQEWVNLTFAEYFGVDRDEMLDQNWTLLTHPDDTHYAETFAACVADRSDFDSEVRVKRDDGQWRYMHSWGKPRFDGAGNYLGHIGTSADITERKALEETERQARRHAELVAELATVLEKPDTRPQLQRVVDVLVVDFADYATIEDPTSPEPLLALRHRDPTMTDTVHRLCQHHRLANQDPHSVANALTSDSHLIVSIDDSAIDEHAPDDTTAALLRQLGPTSHIAVPIELGHKSPGVLTAGITDPNRQRYTQHDVTALTATANHASLVIAQTELHNQDHRISLRLQQALLPQRLADTDHVSVAATYQPASDVLEVGGDWYDSIALPDRRLLLVAGDVVGHGLDAAAMMGRLRAGLAALSILDTSPGRMLCLLDDYARGPAGAAYTTVICAMFDPTTGQLDYASAGHPPALVVRPDDSFTWLDAATSSPLCTSAPPTRPQATLTLQRGERLVLYTDGLIERRGETLDSGLQRLRNTATAHRDQRPDKICEALMTMASESPTDDDIVVLCLAYDHL